MKALKTVVFLFFLYITCPHSLLAQSDSAAVASRALLYADSLNTAFKFANWNQYLELSYPGIIKYYGGKNGFQNYVQRAHAVYASENSESAEKTQLIQLENDMREWQCVVRKTRTTSIDGKKAAIISYMVGQSKDEGINWKYVDVAYISVENVIYVMPDIFDTLAIPQRQVIFESNQVASTR